MKSKGNKELKSVSYNSDDEREEMHWIPIDEIGKYNIKPSFLKDRINEIINSSSVLHIVTEVDR